MAIITIARELGTKGVEVSSLLAKRFQARLIDKELLEKSFEEQGGDLGIFERFDEKKPGLFAAFSADQDIYLQMLKLALYSQAAKNHAIILGRGGNVLMEGVPHCLRVRLMAQKNLRVSALARRLHCEISKAEKMVEQSDKERNGFCRYHFNEDWKDATKYDLILNSASYTAEQLADLIEDALQKFITPEKELAGVQMINDRILGQKILNEILIVQRIGIQFLEVQVSSGAVTLQGITCSDGIKAEIEDLVNKITGVKKVMNDIQVVHDIPLRRM